MERRETCFLLPFHFFYRDGTCISLPMEELPSIFHFLGQQHGLSAVVGPSCCFGKWGLFCCCSAAQKTGKARTCHRQDPGVILITVGKASDWVGDPLLNFKSHFEYRYPTWQWFLKGFGWPVHCYDVFWVFVSSFLELALYSQFELSFCCLSWLCVWDRSIHGLGELCFLQEPDNSKQITWHRHLIFRWARSDCCSNLSGVRRLCTSPQALH